MEAEAEGRLTTGQAWQHEFLSERVSVHSKMVRLSFEEPADFSQDLHCQCRQGTQRTALKAITRLEARNFYR